MKGKHKHTANKIFDLLVFSSAIVAVTCVLYWLSYFIPSDLSCIIYDDKSPHVTEVEGCR